MSVLWNRKTVAQAWAQRSLPSSLAHVTWIDFTVGFSAFLLVAVYEYYRRSQPQTLVVEQEIPEPTVDMLWQSVAHIPSVYSICLLLCHFRLIRPPLLTQMPQRGLP